MRELEKPTNHNSSIMDRKANNNVDFVCEINKFKEH